MATAAMASAAVAMASAISASALYVGDLHQGVTEGQLFELFSKHGTVTSVRICRDAVTGHSLGYGYVNYIAADNAFRAISELNHSLVNGKAIRIMWSQRDSDARKSGIGNIFVKNLAESINSVKLQQIFSDFGTILSCKVVTTLEGQSKGYGFVQFESQDSASSAIEKLNGCAIEGKQIYVGNFIKRSERVLAGPDAKYTNLYMKNLDQDITEELIRLKFSEFGKIDKVAIALDSNGNSKGFGFVSFESPDSARKALEAMNGAQLGTKALYVARFQKRAERQEVLRRLHEERRNERMMKYMASNVYIKNIDESVDDNALREHFSGCGLITSAKVMTDEKGVSKGFGFVCYSSPDDAVKAVNTLHGRMFHGKPLYVAIAQRKEDRRSQLHQQFAHRFAGLSGTSSPVITHFYPQIYYPPGVIPQIPPRQSYFYQPMGLRPGWRPNTFVAPSGPSFQPMPLPAVPNNARRQYRGRMNGQMIQQSSQPVSYPPHLQRSYFINSPKDSGSPQMYGSTKPSANDRQRNMRNGSSFNPAVSNPQGVEMLSSMDPVDQKWMLGERLYPLVKSHEYSLAPKITGMLLEMDNSELLLLLDSPEALAAKVDEAVRVLELSKSKSNSGSGDGNSNFLSAEVAVS